MVRNLPASAGDIREEGPVPGLGRSHGVGNGNPLQYSCLENTIDRGAWRATAHGVATVRHDLVTKPPPDLGVVSKVTNRKHKNADSVVLNEPPPPPQDTCEN